jgi:putative ATP-dependent endonuclease of OLD family
MSELKSAPPKLGQGILVDCVRIANFRSLQNVEVLLARTTVLVGMNNAGKTSFLKALHLALGQDRRSLTLDDFHSANSRQNTESEILIDFRIVPVDENDKQKPEFDQIWYDSDFGGDIVSTDTEDNEYIAVRTRITFDSVKNDFEVKRRLLNDWPDFQGWQDATKAERALPRRRFEHIISFFIDAQRDLVSDLRDRSSYIGKLTSKIDISSEDIAALEAQLQNLNEEIVTKSGVLSHIREVLNKLGKTVSSFGERVEVTPVSKKVRDITKGLAVQFKDTEESAFPLDAHGMGTRSWASLLTYQAYISWLEQQATATQMPFHPILSLEEPEAHLHPNAQRSVYEQLVNTPGQKIISTHSPYIVGHAELSSIRHFHKTGANTEVKSLPVSDFKEEDIRKIRREVMNTRGELLFARAVVLFEGETEEQALPIFARHHWNEFPFERGVVFVGVGGDGNYLPFIRTLDAMGIPWLIFSDGEPEAQKHVQNAIEKLGDDRKDYEIVTLPDNANIEHYLLNEGYVDALKAAAIAFHEPFQSHQHKEKKSDEIRGWDDKKLLKFMKSNKTALSPYWAHAISSLEGERSIPPAIRDLLNRIDKFIG